MTQKTPDGLHRVALLGCGRVSRLAHLATLAASPDASLVGVADPDLERREHAKQRAPSAASFSDFEDLLTELRPSAVIIALPTPLHRKAATAAFDIGAHVYLEKPIAESLDDARALHGAWRSSGRIGRIGFNCRFNRLYGEMKAAISARDLGNPIAVRTALTARWPGDAGWRVDPSLGGGALLELASHHIDLLRFLFDTEVESVTASTWSNRGADEAAMLQLRLRNGVHAQTLVAYGTREEDRFEVYCSDGKLSIDRYDSLILDRSPAHAAGGMAVAARRLKHEVAAIGYGLEKRRAAGQEPSFAESITQFLTDSRDGVHTAPDFTDGLRALEVVDAARRSAAERRVVELA